jgi:DegV family protein with EDD domain
MANRVCIITDSTADIPNEIAKEYQINIVPIYVRFGDNVYRDGVDLSPGQFYEKLGDNRVIPSTSQPSPEDFFKVYSEEANNSTGIISIHISSKISGTYNSALLAKRLLSNNFPIEVIDSTFNSAGLALTVLTAAKSAREGKDMQSITSDILKAISEIKMFGMFSTTKYLARSGRVNKAIAVAGNFLNVKPLMTFRDGEIIRAGFVRTVPQGINRIVRFIESKMPISELMIVHSEVPEQAEQLKTMAARYIDSNRVIVGQLGATLGVHGGPGVLIVAVR